ncbi:MAG: hypothetical protein HYW78_04460, partial [Parcubacteria group bacterium]|nr:hypothetical protein [Parcubacteria group bacterium]
MKQLYKEMYYDLNVNLFGLRNEQMRYKDKIMHNAGWYNAQGEKLGWGDLSAEDFKNIESEIADGELFITLYEHDAFWNFVVKFGAFGGACATKPEEKVPGIGYIKAHCAYIIAKEKRYFVDRNASVIKERYITRDGIEFWTLTAKEA